MKASDVIGNETGMIPGDLDEGVIGHQETEDERQARIKNITGQAALAFKGYKAILSNPDWKVVEYTGAKGIASYELPNQFEDPKTKKVPRYTVKATGLIEGKSADSIARAHMDANKVTRMGWDIDVSDIGLLETIKDDESATGMRLNVQYAEHIPALSLAGVAKREFVFFQFTKRTPSKKNKHDGSWVIIAESTNHPRRPVTPSAVRALTYSVIILEPLEPEKDDLIALPRTSMTIVGWVQPGGWIPDSAVNLYKTKLADRIKFLRETSFTDIGQRGPLSDKKL